MSDANAVITTFSTRAMATDIARAAHRLTGLRRSQFRTPDAFYAALEQQLDAAGYWFDVLTHDTDSSGFLLRGAVQRTGDAIELTAQLVRLWRQQMAQSSGEAA